MGPDCSVCGTSFSVAAVEQYRVATSNNGKMLLIFIAGDFFKAGLWGQVFFLVIEMSGPPLRVL
tara:strand:- start:535 stop:726 length:192 start_codon:yes stop_codon:yes gene_type:complete